jgi:hypothetical protein
METFVVPRPLCQKYDCLAWVDYKRERRKTEISARDQEEGASNEQGAILFLGLQLGDEVQRQHILFGRLEPGHGAELASAVRLGRAKVCRSWGILRRLF